MPFEPNQGGLNSLYQRLKAQRKQVADDIEAAGKELATTIADDARANHPFITRSGLTDQETQPTVTRTGDESVQFGALVTQNAHSVNGYYYPFRLEKGWNGRFTFLRPARDRAQAEVIARLRGIKLR